MDTVQFIKDNCVLRWGDGVELYARDGSKFTWALDLRKALLNQDTLVDIAQQFLVKYEQFYPYQLAAVETSGIPLMTAIQTIAAASGIYINGVVVRKKRKKHLQQDHIDGVDAGVKTIVVDDAMNSGSSMLNAIVKLRDAKYNVAFGFAIVSFNSSSGVSRCAKEKIRIDHLYNLNELGIKYDNPHYPKNNYNIHWTFASPDPNLGFAVAKSKPVIHKNTIMFGSDCGTFWCLNKDTGRIKWFFGTKDKTGKGIISSPIIDNNRVYFGSYDGTLYCLDADTGAIVWANPCCSWIGSSPIIVRDKIYIGLEFKNDGDKGAMAAFDKETGELIWRVMTKIQLHGSPAYNEKHDVIVWGTNDGTVEVIDIEKREIVRRLKGIGAVKYAAATEGDLAVFGSFDGNIYVWDFVKDRIMFSYHTDDIVYSTPLIAGGKAFMGSADHQFIVVDLENFALLAAFDVKEKVHSSPVLIDDIVYFGTSRGELIGLCPNTLKTMIEYQFPDRLTNAIVSDGHKLFVYAFDNKMWAIGHG